MIQYPLFKNGATIGVTAPSSGVEKELHELVKSACNRLEQKGFNIVCGDTVWTQNKAKSAPAKKRAEEFNEMMNNEGVDLIIPPWGGELLIEILEHIDLTLKTGIATAHGTNLIDLRGKLSDPSTAMWQTVLSTKRGETVIQYSSEKYQKEWQHDNPTPHIFHLTEPTYWKSTGKTNIHLKGRLLGGCIDVIRHLVGTPYGDIRNFKEKYIQGDSVIWYLENCELSTTDLRRSLVQMRLAGWFDNTTGILFGRSPANIPVDNYTVEDIYQELSEELQIPIIYDVDCGHVPPQITFINGAYAEVESEDGKGKITQTFI
ncbi:S66 peptidase family protein [Bacillus sp. JJ1566]|uniref:S66 family peptidase n=1 Tax=Bacillus sp. JJ1566 TaxID=3122961 RepID=UPI0030008B66